MVCKNSLGYLLIFRLHPEVPNVKPGTQDFVSYQALIKYFSSLST